MSTIRDVAELSGVSIATVSNYLNSSKPVSSSTARKIQEAVETLHYTQNAAAKSLRQQTYHEIGVVLPNFDDPYYVQIFKGIENAFFNSSYFVNLAFSYDIPELERHCVRTLLSKQICALIIISCQPEEWKYYYQSFTAKGKPVVMIDRLIKGLDAGFISLDNERTVYELTDALLKSGKRNLRLFSGPAAFTCEADCIRGFTQAYADAGLPLENEFIVETSIEKESAFTNTIRLLKNEQPDIILSTSNLIAEGIVEAARLLGYSGEDIPVLTLGEEHWNIGTQSFAALSTSRPAIKIGASAANMLMTQLSTPLRDSEQLILTSTVPELRLSVKTEEKKEAADEPLKILMLETPAMHTFQGLVKNFENSYRKKVEISFLPHRNMLGEIQNSGSDYDLIMYDIPWLPTLAYSGILMDITDSLSQVDTSAFIPNCLQKFGYFRKRCYGIPFMYAPQMLYYRKDLFEDMSIAAEFEKQYSVSLRPPITLKEYNAIAEFFTAKISDIKYGISLSAAYDECFVPEIYFRLQAFSSRIFNPGGAVTFDNPQTLQAYVNLRRAARYAKPGFMHATDYSLVDDFLKGETAMLITYPAFLSDVTDLRKRSTSIGCSMVPGRTPLLGGWGLGIPAASRQSEAAMRFLHWVCDESISNYFTVMGGQTAIASTYTNDEMVKLYPWLPLYYKTHAYTQLPYSLTLPDGRPIPSAKIDSILCRCGYEVLNTGTEIQSAIKTTQEELQSFIAGL